MNIDGTATRVGIALRKSGEYEVFVCNSRTDELVRIAINPVAAWKIAANSRIPITAEAIDE
ncbi:MAG: hypothetical protein ACRYG4_04195 [Janthinobacterium lividum]